MLTDQEKAVIRGLLEASGRALYTLAVAVKQGGTETGRDTVVQEFGKVGDAIAKLVDVTE